MTRAGSPDWNLTTVALALLAGVVGLLFAVLLDRLGAWPAAQWSHFIFGGVCAATLVQRRHPSHPALSFVVFVPATSVVLVIFTMLFHWYILGNSL